MSFDRTFAGPQPAGLILAGGAGRRMGGVDKAGLRLNDETLLARALRRIAPQVDLIALSVGGDMARAEGHHIAALPDPQAYLGDGPLSVCSPDWFGLRPMMRRGVVSFAGWIHRSYPLEPNSWIH